MKKTILAITLMLAALTAGAQTMYDALTFSQNNYYGTARMPDPQSTTIPSSLCRLT